MALGGGRPAGSRVVQKSRTFRRDGDTTVLVMAGDWSNTAPTPYRHSQDSGGEERWRSPLRLKEAA